MNGFWVLKNKNPKSHIPTAQARLSKMSLHCLIVCELLDRSLSPFSLCPPTFNKRPLEPGIIFYILYYINIILKMCENPVLAAEWTAKWWDLLPLLQNKRHNRFVSQIWKLIKSDFFFLSLSWSFTHHPTVLFPQILLIRCQVEDVWVQMQRWWGKADGTSRKSSSLCRQRQEAN